MNIGTVVEGPTDYLVLEAVLDKLLPGDAGGHRFFPLQPISTFGQTGAGWKGVRRWCRQIWQRPGPNLDMIISGRTGPPLDLLVIHVDADIAFERDLQDGNETIIADMQAPCPPVSTTTDQLRLVVMNWLRLDAFPPQLVLAIPAQDTENWTFAALFPDDDLCERDDYECIRSGPDQPGYRLTLSRYGRILRRKSGGIKKTKSAYRQVISDIVAAWDDDVCHICTQATKFTQDVLYVARK